MKKEDLSILKQLVQSLEKDVEQLEVAYSSKNANDVNSVKKEIANIQNKIIELGK